MFAAKTLIVNRKAGADNSRMSDVGRRLNDRQRAAVAHDRGPMLVRAGAGTGKTTVLIERIARLVESGVAAAAEVLAITFTNAAAENMRNRLQARLPATAANAVQTCTFHSYCHAVLKRYSTVYDLLPPEDLWVFLRKNIERLGLVYFAKASDPGTFLKTLNEFFDRCNDELVSVDDYETFVEKLADDAAMEAPRVGASTKESPTREESIERCREIARVFRKVNDLMNEAKIGSYGSLVVGAARLLRNDALALVHEQRNARFILVDEFQDTNHAQLELIRLLSGAEQNVFVVGDPDQAIYRFRGASAGAFDDFRRAFPAARAVTLAENQRSLPNVLRVAHEIIRANPDTTALGSDFARVPLSSGRAKREASRDHRVALITHDGPEHEAQEIARLIAEDRRKTQRPWEHYAILFRSHSTASAIIAGLDARGIPASLSAVDLLETDTVRDLMALLRCLVTLDDPLSLFRVATMRQSGISAEDLRSALANNKARSVVQALETFEAGKKLLARVQQWQRQMKAATGDAESVVKHAVKALELTHLPEVRHFLRFVCEWMDKPCVGGRGTAGRLADLLEYLDLWRQAGGKLTTEVRDELGRKVEEAEIRKGTVVLMTVHAAKGLEFPYVYIAKCASASFPRSYKEALFSFPQQLRKSSVPPSGDDVVHYEEERRLFYVAVTRAMDQLCILGKSARGKEPLPKHYMRELGTNALERTVEVRQAARYVAPAIAAAAAGAWHDLPPAIDPATFVLSASSIETYKSCPKKFYFEYEWKIPGEASAAMQYGSAMHRALKDLYDRVNAGVSTTKEQLLARFREAFGDASIADQHQYEMFLKQGCEHLSEFYERAQSGTPPRVLATEEKFMFALGPVKVRGTFDRVDEIGGGLAVVDYKTGAPKSEEQAQKSLQLSIYAMAAAEKFERPVVQVGFYSLENNEAVFTSRDEKQLAKVRDEIVAIAERIAAGDFHPTPDAFNACRYCAYFTLCPATAERLREADAASAAGAAQA